MEYEFIKVDNSEFIKKYKIKKKINIDKRSILIDPDLVVTGNFLMDRNYFVITDNKITGLDFEKCKYQCSFNDLINKMIVIETNVFHQKQSQLWKYSIETLDKNIHFDEHIQWFPKSIIDFKEKYFKCRLQLLPNILYEYKNQLFMYWKIVGIFVEPLKVYSKAYQRLIIEINSINIPLTIQIDKSCPKEERTIEISEKVIKDKNIEKKVGPLSLSVSDLINQRQLLKKSNCQ